MIMAGLSNHQSWSIFCLWSSNSYTVIHFQIYIKVEQMQFFPWLMIAYAAANFMLTVSANWKFEIGSCDMK
jgi:hypothetical protein